MMEFEELRLVKAAQTNLFSQRKQIGRRDEKQHKDQKK